MVVAVCFILGTYFLLEMRLGFAVNSFWDWWAGGYGVRGRGVRSVMRCIMSMLGRLCRRRGVGNQDEGWVGAFLCVLGEGRSAGGVSA